MIKYALALLFVVLMMENAYSRKPAGDFTFTVETGEKMEDYATSEDFHEAREEWEQDNIELEDSCKECEHWENDETYPGS